MKKELKYTFWTVGIFAALVLVMFAGVAGSLMMEWAKNTAIKDSPTQVSASVSEEKASLPPAGEFTKVVIYAPETSGSISANSATEEETSQAVVAENVSETLETTADIPTEQNEESTANLVEVQADKVPVVEEAKAVETLVEEKVEVATNDTSVVQSSETPRAVLAVVVDDMGVNQQRTKEMLRLQGAFTSSFLTYGADLQKLARTAQNAGHEVILHAAMEPLGPANLAPDTIKVSMDEAQIEALFQSMLDKFDGLQIKGVNNHMGSKFTEHAEKLRYVMNMIKAHDMYFLDSKTTTHSQGSAVAKANNVPFVERNVFLDNEDNYDYIRKQLDKAQKIARKRGFAVAICHPKKQTYRVLQEWVKDLPNNDVKLVHLEEVIALANVQK